jgi:hypothetical protein
VTWLWILAAVILLLVMAATIWFKWGSPDFAYGIGKRIIKSIIRAGLPDIIKPASPEELKAIKKADDRGEGDAFNKGSGRPFDRPKGW